MAQSNGRHALIIEDEMLIAMEIEHQLAEIGFISIDFADSPTEALACATRHRPDLITADMRIVGGTGIEAVKAITEALGDVPVIYITGNSEMLADPGSKIIVEKPMSHNALADACCRLPAGCC